jgi:ADP-dependent NAD(P)H-hydrate dehydratase / NAD(P)H-hydrate epimerase
MAGPVDRPSPAARATTLQRIDAGADGCAEGRPLHDSVATRRIEAAALAATAPHALMQRAGFAVARLALAVAPHAQDVWVLAGPGNNGGDGLVAATHLHRAGKRVQVQWLGDAARLPADAADALAQAQAAGVAIGPGRPQGEPPQLVIDALLGIGAARAPEGPLAAGIELANALGAAVLAVDLPSGLHADTGQPLGPQAVRATHTLSLLTLHPGLFTGAGRDHAGRVWLDTLGVAVAAAEASARLVGRQDTQRLAAPRAHAAHKGSFGDVAVVGGAPGMGGALLLAARAALAAGAGRVYWSALDDSMPGLDALQPELMHRARWWTAAPQVLQGLTVVCGCGGGAAVRAALPPLLAHAARLVLDADALNALAAEPALQAALVARAGRGRPTVLTPHPLEAARLLGSPAAEVQRDRLRAATTLASRLGCTVVLKGSGTVIAGPGALPAINPSGNALLATAGTGDVLAGWLGGLWAQHPLAPPGVVAAAAVWRHGHAADRVARSDPSVPSLPAGALIDAMRQV